MKILITSVVFLLCFVSCTKKSPLQQLIHDADVVKVYVFSGEATIIHFETNDIDKIQQWKNFINEDTVEQKENCVSNGKIIFQTSDDSTVMKFSTTKDCAYLVYELKGNKCCNSITNEGRKYIDSLMHVQ